MTSSPGLNVRRDHPRLERSATLLVATDQALTVPSSALDVQLENGVGIGPHPFGHGALNRYFSNGVERGRTMVRTNGSAATQERDTQHRAQNDSFAHSDTSVLTVIGITGKHTTHESGKQRLRQVRSREALDRYLNVRLGTRQLEMRPSAHPADRPAGWNLDACDLAILVIVDARDESPDR